MHIAFIEPLSRAWNRMKVALFKPFDLSKWFVIGFNAFLAGLIEGHRGSGSSRWSEDLSFREFLRFPERAWGWLTGHPGWFIAIVFVGLFLTIIILVLLWLSSRGKFMFLDNVVQEKAEIVNPWKRFKRESHSLFLWRLGFAVIVIAVFIALVLFFFVTANSLYRDSRSAPILFTVGIGFLAVLIFIVIGYITLFLNHFVVPLMYKNNITATQAWSRFLRLFGKRPLHFLFYGVLLFVFIVLFVIAVVIAGLLTCCIGWLLLAIPYIGTVVTLPVWYTFRAFSLEFLAQFGPDYDLFPPPTEASSEETPAKPSE